MKEEIGLRKFFDLKEVDEKYSIKGLTILNVEGYQNTLGEVIVVITTEEPFQMADAPEGHTTHQFAIFVPKDE